MRSRVVFVDDEEHLRIAAEQSFELADMDCICLPDADAALSILDRNFAGILITDIRMPGTDGLVLMKRVLEIDAEFPVILVTGHGDIELAVQSMREGAYDFIEKPYAPERMVDVARRALEKRELTLENRRLISEVDQRDLIETQLTGHSNLMMGVKAQLRAVATTDTDVLIIGDTGTGKEVAARAIHGASSRSGNPFVHINCAALPSDLIESELFGHEAGAFAGAMRARYGKFEHGRGGTVFLDEIDSLEPKVQRKLLQAVESRVITRLGSNDPVELDVRFIASSKKDLEVAVADETFRADLLYRLNVVTIRMPPLDRRREDIPNLFLTFVGEAAARYNRTVPEVPPAFLADISTKDWPGNVRELRNAAERFSLGLGSDSMNEDGSCSSEAKLSEQLAMHEKSLIAAAIAANNGSIKDTYNALGLSRKSLYDKMQKYGLAKSVRR